MMNEKHEVGTYADKRLNRGTGLGPPATVIQIWWLYLTAGRRNNHGSVGVEGHEVLQLIDDLDLEA